MKEQKGYKILHSGASVFRTTLFCLMAALLTLGLSACMPTGKETVNTELFKDKEELKTRTATLKPGMNKEKVFESLGIPVAAFERMSVEEVQSSIYGNSQVTGTPEQLETFKQKMLVYEGYALPYRTINSNSSIGFGTMKLNKKGADLRLVLMFEKNRLLRASVEGSEQVNVNESQYMWGALIRKGIGLAF